MNKKLTAILTLVCFLFTLMPVAAFAETDYLVSMTVASEDENGNADPYDTSGGTTTGSGLRYTPGEEVTVSITPNLENGYCAAQWASEDLGMNISAINQKTSHTFTMPEKNVTIAITFVQHSFTAHKDNGDGTHDVHCFYCGKVQTASEKCVDVHSGGDNETPNGWCDKCSTAMTYTISFNANTGTGSMADVEYTYSENGYTLPANGFTAPENKAFMGWATSANGDVISGSTYSIMSDTTLYAIWEDHTHSYSSVWLYDESCHWRACACGGKFETATHSGPTATATTPQTCTVCGYEIAPATGYTLTLNYAITGSSGAQIGTGSKTVTGIAPGTVVDLSEHWPSQLTTQGSNGTTYYFRAFSYDANGGGSFYNSVTVSENTVMYATWVQQNMVTVEFDTNDGAMSYKRARAGTTYTISDMNSRHIPVRAGYEFAGWSLADDNTADSRNTEITADCTLYAVWQQYSPSYDDDYYNPPPASIPVDVGGDYDAILRDDVVIVRGDEPISGTLDLGKTDAVAIRLPADALEASTGEGHAVTIRFPDDTAATLTDSGLVAARDALRSGESLQIAVMQVDAGALPDSLTVPPISEALEEQMDEWIGSLSVTDYGGEALDDAKLAAESMTTAELERFLENAHETNMMASSLALGDLISFLEDELEARQAQEANTTYINIGGEKTALVAALEVDVKAVKVSGSTRNIEILADRSDAFAWSTNISSAALEEMLAMLGDATTEDVVSNIKAYKVLDNGTLEAKASKVTVNADGTLTLSAMSNGNSVYVFVLEPTNTKIVLNIGSCYVTVNGDTFQNDVAPQIVNNRTVLPIRVVAEALGADVDWDAERQKVTITKGDTVIELFIGKYAALVNGEPVQLNAAPFIDVSRTYLPVRFVSEYLGAIVDWNADTRTVTIWATNKR